MKKLTSLFVYISLCCLLIFAFSFSTEKEKRNFSGKNYYGTFETVNERLTGQYVSYYRNGKKKAEGKLVSGLRQGVWSVWDSTGKLCVKRNYKNGFEFEQLFPETKREGPVALVIKNSWQLKRNNHLVFDYSRLQEKNVVQAIRVSRFIPAEENELLFKKNFLFNYIKEGVKKKSLCLYKPENTGSSYSMLRDSFTLAEGLKILSDSAKISGYEITEDWFFDKERLMAESRILVLSPLVRRNTFSKNGELKTDTVHLFDLYYPHCRNYFAESKIESGSSKHLDDYFFFRDFNGIVFNFADYYGVKSSVSPQRTVRTDDMDAYLLEEEHAQWLLFSGN